MKLTTAEKIFLSDEHAAAADMLSRDAFAESTLAIEYENAGNVKMARISYSVAADLYGRAAKNYTLAARLIDCPLEREMLRGAARASSQSARAQISRLPDL